MDMESLQTHGCPWSVTGSGVPRCATHCSPSPWSMTLIRRWVKGMGVIDMLRLRLDKIIITDCISPSQLGQVIFWLVKWTWFQHFQTYHDILLLSQSWGLGEHHKVRGKNTNKHYHHSKNPPRDTHTRCGLRNIINMSVWMTVRRKPCSPVACQFRGVFCHVAWPTAA